MRTDFLYALFNKLTLTKFVGLCLLCHVTLVESVSECPTNLPFPDCSCQLSMSGLIYVECRLENETSLESVFNSISAGDLKLDKLAILKCSHPVEIINQLPKFQCRSLQISQCGIQRVNEKAFDALSDSLQELILSHNKITVFPFLKNLRMLSVVNLNYNALRDIPERSFDGLDKIRQVRVKNNQICLLLPNALAETKLSLELLDLSGNCFNLVPAQNLRNAVNLEYLNLANNQIGNMTQMQFMNLPSLLTLRLDNNRLTKILPNAFMNVPSLSRFFARGNQLNKFDPATLQAFKQLKMIDLGRNLLVKSPQFKDHPNLTEIHLDNNKIEKIDTVTFSGNPNLLTINLRNNLISTISRNSFDSLNKINYLFLSNNSIKSLDRFMFDGMNSLRYLALTKNYISEINPQAFSSVPNLYALDLSNNRIEQLKNGTFAKLSKLEFVILSNNTHLTRFEKGCFESRVGTILLDGINLNCDSDFDWFVLYLVRRGVRTFLPNQPEIRCATPPKYADKRLKDLMMTKANETIATSMQKLGFGQGINGQSPNKEHFLSHFLPNFSGGRGSALGKNSLQSLRSIPVLNSITQAMPSLREIPGLNALTQRGMSSNKQLDRAIEQFAEPLVHFASGGQPLPSDIGQLLNSIPNLVVNIPGLGDVDISKLPPSVIQNVLNGGQIPGIPRETLEKVVKQYMERLYIAAAKAQNIEPTGVDHISANSNYSKFLIPVSNLPPELVTKVIQGDLLPHLSEDQTKTILEYYTHQVPTVEGMNITSFLSPKTLQMMKLLPKGFNMSELPSEFIKSAMQGELPDLSLMPPSLLQHFKDNLDDIISQLNSNGVSEMSIDELLKKLPKFDLVDASTFSPYDINVVDSDLVISERDAQMEAYNTRFYTAIGLGLVSAATIVILIFFCYQMSRQNRVDQVGSSVSMLAAANTENNQPKFCV